MKNYKGHLGFIIAFSLTILVFLWKLIFMKAAFLHGDNFVQFYPWLKIYSDSIKQLHFPFWIHYIQCGFPLMAEGQIGGFYPLNLLFFYTLPFNVAYNYVVILHFVIAGVFTYFYVRKLGADEIGGYLAALLFCFGSAYAGCFYNIITLRTLAWFPLVLLLIEQYFSYYKLKYIAYIGIVLGIQLLAGFVQMAVYSLIFYAAYFIYRAKLEKFNYKKIFSDLATFVAISILISLPQILLTYQLTKFTGRQDATLGFALWNSFIPLGLFGIVFPSSLISLTTIFYIGIFSIFFIIYYFCILRVDDNKTRGVFLILLLSLFFALGQYNPVYVGLLKILKFYSFRNPSKFLFFTAFSLSVIAGIGFSKFFENKYSSLKLKTITIFRWFLVACVGFFIFFNIVIHIFKQQLLRFGTWYVKYFIYNKPHHRYNLETYLDKVMVIYSDIIKTFSFADKYVILSWLFILLGIILLPILLRKKLRYVIIAIIFIDLLIFSAYGVGFRGNIISFNSLKPENADILTKVKSDNDIFRILPFDLISDRLPNWALPNANIIYGVDSIACYSPLADRTYRNKLKNLEVVDDSLGLNRVNPKALIDNLETMKLLNIKYIISSIKLEMSELELINSEESVFLYKIKNYLPRVFFVDSIEGDVMADLSQGVKILKYDNGLVKIKVNTVKDGYLVFSEIYYPGWNVYVDSVKKDLIKFKDLIQSVYVTKGEHEVIFNFRPSLK